jgi:uncharacterized protein (DUF1778 family)
MPKKQYKKKNIESRSVPKTTKITPTELEKITQAAKLQDITVCKFIAYAGVFAAEVVLKEYENDKTA